MLTECGRCSAIWSPGSEEFDEQICSACGWKMGGSIDNDNDNDDDFDVDDWEEEWEAVNDDADNSAIVEGIDNDDDDLIPYKITLIEAMPTYMGKQFYPGGARLPASMVSVNGETVEQIFRDNFNVVTDDHPKAIIINNYFRYHLLAPCWKTNLTKDEIMSANGEKLFEISIELGIDPI